MQSRTRRTVQWFLIGLVVVLVIGGVIYLVEDSSIPHDVRVQMLYVEAMREWPYALQRSAAISRGVSVEELLTSPYDRWAPKVLVGLMSAYGVAWVIYLAYKFFRFVDRDESNQTPTQQRLL